MAAAILRENHAINATSSGLSSYRTFARAFPQSSGNSADARLKKEYGSVNPGRGGSIEADPAPADEEARVSTPRRATDAVSAGSRHVARHVVRDTTKQSIIHDMTGRDVSDAYPPRVTPVGDTVVARVLDHLGVENEASPRWQEEE